MKNIIINILIALLIGGIGFFAIDMFIQSQEKAEKWNKIAILNSMELEALDGKQVHFDSVSAKKRLIMKFSTGCKHCNEEVEELKKLREELASYELVMMSYNDLKSMRQFVKRHNLGADSMFTFYHDNSTETAFFENTILPALYIYEENASLVFFHEGKMKAEDLKDALLSYQEE